MVALPKRPEQVVIDKIYSTYERAEANKPFYLGRLGSSSIGKECVRELWLKWRGFARSEFNGRMLRLFQTGHQQEARIVADLRNAGFNVWDVNSDGDQFNWIDSTGHLITKIDGVIAGIEGSSKPHILEIKTHNKNSFSALQKHGVKASKPEHYAQVQISMWLASFTRALYVALCKDDESIYVERIKEDKPFQESLRAKVQTLTSATLAPAPLSTDPASFSCRFCDMRRVCYKEDTPAINCRTCDNARVGEAGAWVCARDDRTLTLDQQRAACSNYAPLL